MSGEPLNLDVTRDTLGAQPVTLDQQPASHWDYDLFISYRRIDGQAFANWLRRRLQTYKLPKPLSEGRQRPLRVYIDTTFERANDDFWKQNIEPALQRSRFLVVVVTPGAFQPRPDGRPNWVEREISLFTGLPQGRNVLIALASGDPDGPLPGRLRELFPHIDIVDLRSFRSGARYLWRRRSLFDRTLTLLAALYDVPDTQMPVLREEEERRKRQLAWRITTASLLLLTTVSGLSVVALWQRGKAERERKIALSRQLAAQAEVIRSETPILLERSALLAIESMRRVPLLENDQALRGVLSLLLKPHLRAKCPDNVYALAFSRDGHYLVAGSGDGLARVIEVSTGKEVSQLNDGRRLDAVAFSPNGRLVATGAEDGTARVFEAMTGKEVSRLVHDSSIEVVTFSPDGMSVASASRDRTARIFEASNGRQVFQFEHGDAVWAVTFSPDGRYLATGGGDGSARVFELTTGTQVSHLNHGESVNSVAFSPDGRTVATASDDKTARIFEASTGKELVRAYHQSSVYTVAFSSDGQYLATGSRDATGRVFEVEKFGEVSRLVHSGVVNPAYQGLISRVRFSPDGRFVATASDDGTARVFEAATGQEIGRIVHGNQVTDVAFSPDGQYLATGSFDHIIRLSGTTRANELSHFPIPIMTGRLVLSPNGHYLAVIDKFWNSVPIFDTAGKGVFRLEHGVSGAAFSPDGERFAVAGQGKVARVFETRTGKELPPHLAHDGEIYDLAWSPNGLHFATSSVYVANQRSFTALRLFDANSGQQLWRLNNESLLNRLAVSLGGRYLAAGSGVDSVVWLFEPKTGKQVALKHEGGLFAIAFSPSGEYLAIACGDGTAHVYETSSGRELAHWSHDGPARAVAFSPDNQYVATGGEDRTARVHLVRSGEEVSRLHQQYSVLDVAFTPGGDALVTAAMPLRSLKQEIVIHSDWLRPQDLINAACERLTRNLTLDEWKYYLGTEPYRETCPSALPNRGGR